MLENSYAAKLEFLLERLPAQVQIPAAWTDYFERQGLLPTHTSEHRQFARRYAREEGVLEIDQSLPAIERRRSLLKIYLKDWSRAGVAFLSTHELYPEERILLWTREAKRTCSVVRCTKHNDRCYEIGAILV